MLCINGNSKHVSLRGIQLGMRTGGQATGRMVRQCILCVFERIFKTQFVLRPHKLKKERTSVPLQAWSGPEVSRKLKFPDIVTMAQDGVNVVSLTYRPLYPQEILLVLISIGDRGSTVVKVLCYKSEGRWFDHSWYHWIFH